MLSVAEWIFSAFLVNGIVMFGVGYACGYWRWLNKSKPEPELSRYRYDRDGDTSQCK